MDIKELEALMSGACDELARLQDSNAILLAALEQIAEEAAASWIADIAKEAIAKTAKIQYGSK